jgi:general secretion pathway protein J
MTCSDSRTNPEAGFSLIEVLVALAIGAILMAGAGLALTTSLRANEQLTARAEALAAFEQIRLLMKDDVFFAANRPVRDTSGRLMPAFELSQATDGSPVLSLVRTGWINPGLVEDRSTLQRVVWRIEDGALVREAWARPDPTALTPVDRRVMAGGDISIGLMQYRDGEWRGPNVLSQQGAVTPMPEAVALNLASPDRGQLRFVFLTSASRSGQ